MADANLIEQAVARTLRDSLGRIQGASEELSQAVNDLVAACASSRPSNALPSMVRAQSSAASLSAALEVLSRFVTSALQPASRSSLEQEMALATSQISADLMSAVEQPRVDAEHLTAGSRNVVEGIHAVPEGTALPEDSQVAAPEFTQDSPVEPAGPGNVPVDVAADAVLQDTEQLPPVVELPPAVEPVYLREPESLIAPEPVVNEERPAVDDFAPEPAMHAQQETQPGTNAEGVPVLVTVADSSEPAKPFFDVAKLPEEERELHKRAYRVAKVSMQDIVMLHPEDIRLGRENKDLCFRLRDDIEKAHREYGRRFQSIYNHPVDYFYDWMVEILAAGNAEALGEYPYPSPVLRR